MNWINIKFLCLKVPPINRSFIPRRDLSLSLFLSSHTPKSFFCSVQVNPHLGFIRYGFALVGFSFFFSFNFSLLVKKSVQLEVSMIHQILFSKCLIVSCDWCFTNQRNDCFCGVILFRVRLGLLRFLGFHFAQ